MPAAALAAQAQSHSQDIESLESQYLATNDPVQHKQQVSALKTLARNCSPEDAGALNEAVSAMLPATDSTWEAGELLAIGAANPAVQPAAEPNVAADAGFLVDPRHAAEEARNPNGDVETLADIRIDRLQKDSQGHDGLASALVQQVWRINSVAGARAFSPRSVMYSGMSETLSVVRARVLKSNGREEQASISPDQPVMQQATSMYFDARSRQLRFSHLQPGDVVEIEYQLLPSIGVNPWTEYYARLDEFRDSLLYSAATPGADRTQLDETLCRGTRSGAGRGAGKRRRDNADLGGARHLSPSRGTPGARSGPYLHVSTIGSMEEFGRWYSQCWSRS